MPGYAPICNTGYTALGTCKPSTGNLALGICPTGAELFQKLPYNSYDSTTSCQNQIQACLYNLGREGVDVSYERWLGQMSLDDQGDFYQNGVQTAQDLYGGCARLAWPKNATLATALQQAYDEQLRRVHARQPSLNYQNPQVVRYNNGRWQPILSPATWQPFGQK